MKNHQTNMVEMIDWAVGDAPLAGTAFAGAGLAAAIGNFDGVHRGHQKVVAAAVAAARRDGLLPSVITFDPHPREFFRQDEAPFHLADRREKDRLLAGLLGQMGPARVIHIRFDDALRSTISPNTTQYQSLIKKSGNPRQVFTNYAIGVCIILNHSTLPNRILLHHLAHLIGSREMIGC